MSATPRANARSASPKPGPSGRATTTIDPNPSGSHRSGVTSTSPGASMKWNSVGTSATISRGITNGSVSLKSRPAATSFGTSAISERGFVRCSPTA